MAGAIHLLQSVTFSLGPVLLTFSQPPLRPPRPLLPTSHAPPVRGLYLAREMQQVGTKVFATKIEISSLRNPLGYSLYLESLAGTPCSEYRMGGQLLVPLGGRTRVHCGTHNNASLPNTELYKQQSGVMHSQASELCIEQNLVYIKNASFLFIQHFGPRRHTPIEKQGARTILTLLSTLPLAPPESIVMVGYSCMPSRWVPAAHSRLHRPHYCDPYNSMPFSPPGMASQALDKRGGTRLTKASLSLSRVSTFAFAALRFAS